MTTRRRAPRAFVVTPNRAARWRWRRRDFIRASRRRCGGDRHQRQDLGRRVRAPDLERLGHASASIGTIGLVSPKRTVYGSLTTPDPIALHKQLDEITGDGVTHLAFEASSHGLDQFRLDGVRIAAGGFTNLTRDHMDYHPDVAHYLAAKLRLFRDLVAPGGAAVISADHDCSQEVIEAARVRGLRIIAVGRNGDGAGEGIRLVDAAVEGFAQQLTLEHRGRTIRSSCRWSANSRSRTRWSPPGSRSGPAASRRRCLAALEDLEGAKGRLEQVGEHNGAPIFVDYAHKPDALAKALQALRPYAKRKLVVIFGAGGDRDAGKRPIMGAIAAGNADMSSSPTTIRAAKIRDDPRRHSRRSEERQRNRRSRRGDQGRDISAAAGRRIVDRGQGHKIGEIVGDQVLSFSDQRRWPPCSAARSASGDAHMDHCRSCARSRAVRLISGAPIDSVTQDSRW